MQKISEATNTKNHVFFLSWLKLVHRYRRINHFTPNAILLINKLLGKTRITNNLFYFLQLNLIQRLFPTHAMKGDLEVKQISLAKKKRNTTVR